MGPKLKLTTGLSVSHVLTVMTILNFLFLNVCKFTATFIHSNCVALTLSFQNATTAP